MEVLFLSLGTAPNYKGKHRSSVIAVNQSVKANTLSELIALAKSKPAALTLASSRNGTLTHLAGEVSVHRHDTRSADGGHQAGLILPEQNN